MESSELLNKLKLMLKGEDYKGVIRVYEGLDDKSVLDYRHYRAVAISYINVFDYDKALETFRRCIESYPKIEERDYVIVEPLYVFAHKLLKNRQYREFDESRELLLLFNRDYYFFRTLSRKKALFQRLDKGGYFDKAITLLNHIVDGEKFLRLDSERELHSSNWEELCFDRLQRARELAEEFDLVWELLGIYYMLILDFEEAEKHFKKAMMMNLGCETIPYNLGLLNEKRGFYDDAITLYKKALEIDPGYGLPKKHIRICESKILSEKAESLSRRRRFEEALSLYERSLELNPGDSSISKKIEAIKKSIFKDKLSLVTEYINRGDPVKAELILGEVSSEYPRDERLEELKRSVSQLKQALTSESELKKNFQRDVRDTDVLLSVIEILRDSALPIEEKQDRLSDKLSRLSIERQKAVLDMISSLKSNDGDLINGLDEGVKRLIDEINVTKSVYIPAAFDSSEGPLEARLSISVNRMISVLVDRYPYWDRNIPTEVAYEITTGKTVYEKEFIGAEGIILVDRRRRSVLDYQIWVLKDKSFLVLRANRILRSTTGDGESIIVVDFAPLKTDFNDVFIQAHRYEVFSVLKSMSRL